MTTRQTILEIVTAKTAFDEFGFDLGDADLAYIAHSEGYANPYYEGDEPPVLPCRIGIASPRFEMTERCSALQTDRWQIELYEDGDMMSTHDAASLDVALRIIKDWAACDRGRKGLLL